MILLVFFSNLLSGSITGTALALEITDRLKTQTHSETRSVIVFTAIVFESRQSITCQVE
jgi:hypothetical protein